MHADLLINGVFIGGACDQSIGKTQHYAPYDGTMVGTAAEAGWSEVDAAIDAAETAFAKFRFSTPQFRSDLLQNIARNVRERADELAQLLTIEVGKPITFSRGEVTRLALTFELAAKEALHLRPEAIDISYDPRYSGQICEVTRFPLGPILAIVPYNWPYNLAAHKIAPALATGNTVVVKAPSTGTLSTLLLGRIIKESGCPDGVVNVINCVPALAEKAALDPRIKMLSFTGSPKVGWMLKEKLPHKKVALELGGDATAILTESADLVMAAKNLVISAFGYAGQICISTQHILVHDSVYDRARDLLTEETINCTTGNPTDENVICGPVISDESAERIMEWIDLAEAQGATVLAGGQRSGRVIEPVLIEGVTRKMHLGCQEVFGPVATLNRYSSDKEAIEWINESEFGIHHAVFSHDEEQVNRFYQEIECGGLIVNDAPSLRFDAMPYGGVKRSGFGREGITFTMQEMTEPKAMIRG